MTHRPPLSQTTLEELERRVEKLEQRQTEVHYCFLCGQPVTGGEVWVCGNRMAHNIPPCPSPEIASQ